MRTLQIKAQEKHGGTSPASLSDPEAPPIPGPAQPCSSGQEESLGGGVSLCLRKASAHQATQGAGLSPG